MREAFQLYQRNSKWMARFWNEDARRYVNTLTLDATDKQAAHDEAQRRQKEELPSRENPLLVRFLNDFWSDVGAYAKLKEIRGKALSPRYLVLCRSAVRLHVEPYKPFAKMRVGDVLPVHLEEWQSWMAQQGTGARSANIALQAVRTAVRRRAKGRREPDPLPGIVKAEEKRIERGLLTVKEVQAVIAKPKGTSVHDRTVVLLGALAGLRLGEVRGLRWEDIDFDTGTLKVARSIPADEKAPRAPKWGSTGELPLSDPLAAELKALQAKTKDTSGYVLGIGGQPMGTTGLRGAFRRILDAIGIDAEKRKARRLSFHGLRHTFVSMGRLGNIPDWLMQRLARHKTAAMTTNTYSSAGVIDFKDAQKRLTDSVRAKKKAR